MTAHLRRTAASGLSLLVATTLACTAATTDPAASSAVPGAGTASGASAGDTGSTAVAPAPSARALLSVSLVDRPPSSDVSEIFVNIVGVRAHSTTDGWVTLVPSVQGIPGVVDLLTLQHTPLDLGLASLNPGTITQIRLLLGEAGNSVTVSGTPGIELKVPSGIESGIKILGPWTIDSCTTTRVVLDFDGKNSIWYHPTGQGDEWILRPVIHAASSDQEPYACAPTPPEPPPASPPPAEPPVSEPPMPPAPVACDAAACAAVGGTCASDTCLKPPGADCLQPTECSSNVCVAHQCGAGGSGTSCTASGACLSGACSTATSTCDPGVAGAPCRADADCTTGRCDPTSSTCAPGSAGGTGTTCTTAGECLSGACGTSGTCGPGQQGAPCVEPKDCDVGLACVSSYCYAPAN